jgi:hypothetical protein
MLNNQMVLGIPRDNDHGNQWINVDYLRSPIFREIHKKNHVTQKKWPFLEWLHLFEKVD